MANLITVRVVMVCLSCFPRSREFSTFRPPDHDTLLRRRRHNNNMTVVVAVIIGRGDVRTRLFTDDTSAPETLVKRFKRFGGLAMS